MPAIFHIRRRFDVLWAEAKKRLEVTADQRDRARPRDRGAGSGSKIERQTDRTIDLSNEVDPEILGGLVLRVGNRVLDASLRASWKD